MAVLLLFTVCRLLLLRSPGRSASAVETSADIGVYWNKDCTRRVNSISWGAIAPGETSQVIVYVRNEGNETLIPSLTTLNWQPEDALLWLDFSWSCQETSIAVGQVVEVTQILSVAPDLSGGFSSFRFDTVFGGSVVAENAAPTISEGYVTPTTGNTSTLFYYYVSYYDPEGMAPTDLKPLCIDGSEWHSMGLCSGSASNGVYRCQLTLSAGSHNYSFQFSDGVNPAVTLPSAGSYSGPTVAAINQHRWDIDQDCQVDIFDLYTVAVAFESTPESPNWNKDADVNGDGTIDIIDLATVAKYYGEEYT